MYMTHLECARDGSTYDGEKLHNLSDVGAPLLACYDLEKAAETLRPEALQARPPNMWRYREVMPIRSESEIVSLGEGFTPLHRAERLGTWAGFSKLYIKDESVNPTGSFKARGLSAAVTAARARGAKALAIPTASTRQHTATILFILFSLLWTNHDKRGEGNHSRALNIDSLP